MNKFIKYTLLISSLFVIFFVYVTAIQKIANTSYINSDFGKIYNSARAYSAGSDIYKTEVSQSELTKFDPTHKLKHVYIYNLNPPVMVLFTLPAGLVSYKTAFYIWMLISFGLVFYTIYLLQKTYGAHRPDKLLDYLFVLFNYLIIFPTVIAFLAGQVTFLLLWLLVLGWMSGRKQAWIKAGIYFGLLVCLKLYFGLFFLVFVLQKRWKAVGSYMVTILIANGIALLMFGVNNFISYQKIFKNVVWYTSTWNVSLYGTVARIFPMVREANYVVFPVLGIGMVVFIIGILITLLGFIATNRIEPDVDKNELWDLSVAYTTVAMLFLSPLGWLYYFPLYILPFFILWHIAKSRVHGQTFFVLLLLAAFLMSIPTIFQLPGQIRELMGALISPGFPFLAQIILLVLSLWVKYSPKSSRRVTFEKFNLCYSMALIPSLIAWYKIFLSTN